MFRQIEQEAIEEKIQQLKKIKDGTLSPQELADLITKRRVSWFKENKKLFCQNMKDCQTKKRHTGLYSWTT